MDYLCIIPEVKLYLKNNIQKVVLFEILKTKKPENKIDYISDIMITGRNRGWITLPSTEERMSIIVDK